MEVNRDAHANANERSRYFSIESPVAECRRLCEAPFLFDGEQIKPYGLWISLADRRRKIGRFARNVGFDQRLCRGHRRYQKLTLHSRPLVAGNTAEIDEVSGFCRTENNRRAGALAVHPWRFRVLVGKHDVMFGALTIDQGELHDLSFGSGQTRVRFPIYRPTDTNKTT